MPAGQDLDQADGLESPPDGQDENASGAHIPLEGDEGPKMKGIKKSDIYAISAIMKSISALRKTADVVV